MTLPKTKPRLSKTLIFSHIAAVIVVAIWGGSFISSDALLKGGMGPLEIAVYRFIIAYLVLLLVSHKKFLSNSIKDELMFVACGLLAISIYYIGENVALQYTQPTNVSLLTSTSPLFTAFLIGMLYKNERPGRGAVVGSLIAFIGVGCVIFNSTFLENSEGFKFGPIGDMLSLACALSWSFYSLILRKLNVHYDNLFITRKTFFYGIITAIPMWLSFENPTPPDQIFSNTSMLFNLGFLSLGASLIAFMLWGVIVKRMGALKANNYIYLQAPFTLIFSIILIPETAITILGISGIILILGGLWLGDWLSQRQNRLKS